MAPSMCWCIGHACSPSHRNRRNGYSIDSRLEINLDDFRTGNPVRKNQSSLTLMYHCIRYCSTSPDRLPSGRNKDMSP
eukprot:6352304-Pyramimonas_sp.AAC.1